MSLSGNKVSKFGWLSQIVAPNLIYQNFQYTYKFRKRIYSCIVKVIITTKAIILNKCSNIKDNLYTHSFYIIGMFIALLCIS